MQGEEGEEGEERLPQVYYTEAISHRPNHNAFTSACDWGSDHLLSYLRSLEQIGVNHVALNLRFNQHGIEHTLERIAKTVLPEFPTQHSTS